MISIRYLTIILVLSMIATGGCSKRDSVAQAAETVNPVPSGPKTVADDPKAVDQVKHKVMAFDLEGLADDGSKKWDVKGQSAEAVTENQVKLNNVVAGTYGKDAQATITADTGLYDKSKNNVRLEQNVKAVIENTQKSTENFVTFPSGASDASKPGTASAANANNPKKAKTIITCDAEVEFNYEKNEGYFNKNVRVVNDDGTIDADKITIYFDQATKAVSVIIAEGNVKIQRGENLSYSDKATYIAAEKKIILSGRPKLVMYQEGGSPMNFMDSVKK